MACCDRDLGRQVRREVGVEGELDLVGEELARVAFVWRGGLGVVRGGGWGDVFQDEGGCVLM